MCRSGSPARRAFARLDRINVRVAVLQPIGKWRKQRESDLDGGIIDRLLNQGGEITNDESYDNSSESDKQEAR